MIYRIVALSVFNPIKNGSQYSKSNPLMAHGMGRTFPILHMSLKSVKIIMEISLADRRSQRLWQLSNQVRGFEFEFKFEFTPDPVFGLLPQPFCFWEIKACASALYRSNTFSRL